MYQPLASELKGKSPARADALISLVNQGATR